MKHIIKLTLKVEAAAIKYGNSVGLVDREIAAEILKILRGELEHEIRMYERKHS